MIERGYRVVPFAGEVLGVEWSGALARRVAELALGPCADASDERLPDAVLRVGAHDDAPLLTLFLGHTCLYRGESVGAAVHALLQAALDSLIGRSRGGLVIHAGLLDRGGAGVLLPGATGSGKTMLTAWLSLRGLVPLSDEACYLADAAAQLQSFARPFCFKGPWAEMLGVAGAAHGDVLQDAGVSLVPRALLCAVPPPAALAPRLIVFPRYQPDAAPALTRLTPARAAVRLLETVANARNLPDHGRGRVTELARTVDTYSLTYGHFDQLDEFVALVESLA